MNNDGEAFLCGFAMMFIFAMLGWIHNDRTIDVPAFEKGFELCKDNSGLSEISFDVLDYTFKCNNGASFYIKSTTTTEFKEEK